MTADRSAVASQCRNVEEIVSDAVKRACVVSQAASANLVVFGAAMIAKEVVKLRVALVVVAAEKVYEVVSVMSTPRSARCPNAIVRRLAVREGKQVRKAVRRPHMEVNAAR